MDDKRQQPRSPLTKLCALWEHESAKGNLYMTGRLADAKVLVVVNNEKETDRDPDFWLCVVHAPREQKRDGQVDRRPPPPARERPSRQRELRGDSDDPQGPPPPYNDEDNPF
jgi:hypothetical protein